MSVTPTEARRIRPQQQQRVLIIRHTDDSDADEIYQNTRQAFDYARLQYDVVSLPEPDRPDLTRYSCLAFITRRLGGIGAAHTEAITRFVEKGGGAVVLCRGWNPRLAKLLGMAKRPKPTSSWRSCISQLFGVATPGPPAVLKKEEGGRFVADLFPGIKGVQLEPRAAYHSFDVSIAADAELIAVTSNDRPLAWRRTHGQGRVIYWNTVALAAKNMRGLIVQSVANAQGAAVLPLANVATIQIDDFPAAFVTQPVEPIATEYDGLTAVQFYHQIWFPDMLELAQRYGVPYTYLIPFNYNDQTKAPFPFTEWNHATVEVGGEQIRFAPHAARLASDDGELGLHGYNHFPLTVEHWENADDMAESLTAAMKQWADDELGPMPTTYVPPNNSIDEVGARVLSEAVPSLRVISTYYAGGGFATGSNREFGPEPWNHRLFSIPRATVGYTLDEQIIGLLSELGTMGVWTHFLHPDDVFDTPNNNPEADLHRNPDSLYWRGDNFGRQDGLYYHWCRWLDFVRTHYPWLRFMRTRDAHKVLRDHLENEVSIVLNPGTISVQSTKPTYFQVRFNDGRRLDVDSIQGAELVHCHRGDGYMVYTLRGISESVELKCVPPNATDRGRTN